MRLTSLLMTLGMAACGCTDGSLPLPPASLETWCRCNPPMFTLAVCRVDGDPVPFVDERYSTRWSGMEFDVIVERILPTGSTAGLPASSTRIHVRQYLATSRGNPIIGGTGWDHPQYTRVVRGQRLLVQLQESDPGNPNPWSLGIVSAVSSEGGIQRAAYSFPAGTDVGRVLDPVEWSCPAGGPRLGDCDAGVTGYPWH